MSYSRMQESYMVDYIKEQLKEFGYTDTEGKSRKELTSLLARFRAMEVKVSNPESSWF